MLNKYQVVVATCAMAGKLYNNGMDRHHFDVVVVDECGHAWESEVVAASSFLLKATGLLVLAGDPMQLGPVTHSDTDMKTSMLERLVARPIYARDLEKFPATGGYDPSCVTKLLQTYRCHPQIIKVSNELFYDNDLLDKSGPEARTLLSWDYLIKSVFPLIFHGVNGENERESNNPSWFNQSEVEQVLQYVQLLRDHARVLPSDIGIIAPYQKQVKKIQMGLRVRGYDKNIMVGSCEQFQGQEKRVIIISTVRTSKELIAYDSRFQLGFVANCKRMNVAITRAKALLIVIGSPAVLKEDKHWRCLLKHCHDNGAYTGVPFSLNDGNSDGNSDDGGVCEALSRMQLDDEEFNEPPPYDGGETKEI
jgi:superfamily I DNA and/or RNA helicase